MCELRQKGLGFWCPRKMATARVHQRCELSDLRLSIVPAALKHVTCIVEYTNKMIYLCRKQHGLHLIVCMTRFWPTQMILIWKVELVVLSVFRSKWTGLSVGQQYVNSYNLVERIPSKSGQRFESLRLVLLCYLKFIGGSGCSTFWWMGQLAL